MSTLFLGNYVQFFDDNGNPLSGGEVDFYEVGTSTPKDVYTDSGLTTPASNPVTLDAAGRAKVWLNGDYKVRTKKSDGTVVETADGVNPPVETETSGGNLIANGSFETQGNASTAADGWTLTAQSDGTVERVTTDSYDGEACLKFTSDGSGGGQADTDAFFAVSPGRTYGVSFALKCSVADIRNIVQVRYFDKDKTFLSASTVYDEDTSNPTSWEIKSFTDTPPSNARFAKLRILGADQSDVTAGEAKFDSVSTRDRGTLTATDGQINAVASSYDPETLALDGDFSDGEVYVSKVGRLITISSPFGGSHANEPAPSTTIGFLPAYARPVNVINAVSYMNGSGLQMVQIQSGGALVVSHRGWDGSQRSTTDANEFTISYLVGD